MKKLWFPIYLLLAAAFIASPILPSHAQLSDAEVTVLDRDSKTTTHLTDGDTIRLRLILPEKANQLSSVTFQLVGTGIVVAECSVSQGQNQCETEPFTSLGWYWDPGGIALPTRTVEALIDGTVRGASVTLDIASRPVVLVHGFSSDAQAWKNYLGQNGYLASAGLRGFAVGDGQVPGVMNTGSLANPTGRTNTIAQNAAILGQYIAAVKQLTGAQKVDLVGHSMGGMISRFYIDRVMPEGEVAQLIMLGSPMAGSSCVDLPAALGFYLPASLEIQPSYMQDIFNPQITHRHGVIFHALAGVPIREQIGSPCTSVPSDIVVSLESVQAIPLDVTQTSFLHTDLNTSDQVFREYVLPKLQAPAGSLQPLPDPVTPANTIPPMQFTRMYTGHLKPGQSQDLVIHIESNVSVASFALYDYSRSLAVEVKGASGKVLALDPIKNGLVQIDDPTSMIYLGYGFNNPKPGAWHVNLMTTEKTPASGADYSLTAVFQGGATLSAQTNKLIPQLNEPVQFTARLELNGEPLAIAQAQALIRKPDGTSEILDLGLAISSNDRTLTYAPAQAGLYGIQISASGSTPDGFLVERTAFLTIETQPAPAKTTLSAVLIVTGLVVLFLLMAGGVLVLRRTFSTRKSTKVI